LPILWQQVSDIASNPSSIQKHSHKVGMYVYQDLSGAFSLSLSLYF
jgi:hypothetical protein